MTELEVVSEFVKEHPEVSLSQLCRLNGIGRNYIINLKYKKRIGKKAMNTLLYLLYLGRKNPEKYRRKNWIWRKE